MLNSIKIGIFEKDGVEYFQPVELSLNQALYEVGAIKYPVLEASSSKADYATNGNINYVEWFNSPTQIEANRVARSDLTYNSDFNVTQEVLKIYDADGTTILRNYTYVFTYSGMDLMSFTETLT